MRDVVRIGLAGLLAALLLTLGLVASLARADGGQCGCAEPCRCADCHCGWHWRPYRDGDPCGLVLVDAAGVQRGCWRRSDGTYWPVVRDGRGRRLADAPCAPPVELPEAERRVRDFGMDATKLRPGRVSISGREATMEEALDLIGGPPLPLPDDSTWQRVTLIGPEADRRRITADWSASPDLAPYRTRAVLKDYDPSSPLLKETGFRAGLYVQAADGTVLHRQDAYTGAHDLATALRRADPAYDPTKDPDLCHPPTPPAPLPVVGPASAAALVPQAVLPALTLGIGLALLLPRRRIAA